MFEVRLTGPFEQGFGGRSQHPRGRAYAEVGVPAKTPKSGHHTRVRHALCQVQAGKHAGLPMHFQQMCAYPLLRLGLLLLLSAAEGMTSASCNSQSADAALLWRPSSRA